MLEGNHNPLNTNTSPNYHPQTRAFQQRVQNNRQHTQSPIQSSLNISASVTQPCHAISPSTSIQQMQLLLKQKDMVICQIYKQIDDLKSKLEREGKRRLELEINLQELKQKYKRDSATAQQNIEDLQEIMKQSQIIQQQLFLIKTQLADTKIINQQLETQIQVLTESNRTIRQALLYSEQENYNFRLQIRKFLKSKDNLHDLSTERSQIKYLDELSCGDSRTKNQVIQSKSIDIEELQFRKQLYAHVFQIINYLPIHDDQLLVYQAENDEQLLYQLQSVKSICFEVYQQQKNYQSQLNILEKQMVGILHRIVQKYAIPQEQLQSHLNQLQSITNLKSYAHELYSYSPYSLLKSEQMLQLLDHQ